MNQTYSVIQPFTATEPISGRERQFKVGDMLLYDMSQTGPSVLIEFEWSRFMVERSIFTTCCRIVNSGTGGD